MRLDLQLDENFYLKPKNPKWNNRENLKLNDIDENAFGCENLDNHPKGI